MKMTVSTNTIEEFKRYMRITHDEDDNLRRLLSFSISYVKTHCGDFDIDENEQAKELVFERTRYLYNDALEFFEDNFLSEITSLGLSLSEGDADDQV